MKLAQYKVIAKDVNADLTAALAKHGLALVKLTAGVDEMLGEVRWTITARDTAMTETPEEIRWKQYAKVCGLNPEWLGQTVRFGNGPATIAGLLHTRSEKSVALTQGDKRSVCSPEALKRVAITSGLKLQKEQIGTLIGALPYDD
jgi:hypothetical protein